MKSQKSQRKANLLFNRISFYNLVGKVIFQSDIKRDFGRSVLLSERKQFPCPQNYIFMIS